MRTLPADELAREIGHRGILSSGPRPLGLTDLFISRNLAGGSHTADRVGVMYLGHLVEFAEAGELFAWPRHPSARMLLDAIPDREMTGKPRSSVAGEVPDPLVEGRPIIGCYGVQERRLRVQEATPG